MQTDYISISEYNALDKARCAAFRPTLFAIYQAYEAGRITAARRDELEHILRTEHATVFRADRIRGFIAWAEQIQKELEA